MKTEQFNRILENLNEIPSENCWKSIENQLNIVMPANGNSINSSNVTITKSNSILGKIAASPFKAAAISGSVIAVSTASIIFINTLINKSDLNNITTNLPIQTSILQVDSTNQKNEQIEKISQNDVVINEPKSVSPISEVTQFENKQIVTQIQPIPIKEPAIIQPQSVQINSKVENIPNKQVSSNSSVMVPQNIDPIIEEQDLPETKPIKITIPNIFTPNGDGYNDYFVIEGIEECKEPKLYIKSKSGQLVYQSTNYQNDWNGENCNDGIYMYYFTYKINNIEEKMTGRVIIKR